MKPLGAGKNFLSDAYFGTVKHFDFKNGEQSKKIFIKVTLRAFYLDILNFLRILYIKELKKYLLLYKQCSVNFMKLI